MVAELSDEDVWRLNRGGHDPFKVYAAFDAASKHTGQPTVILAKTIKGYGMGEAGEAMNITHQLKKMPTEAVRRFRDRFQVPVPDDKLAEVPYVKFEEGSKEHEYMKSRRRELGGDRPKRRRRSESLKVPPLSAFDRLLKSTEDREISTTMALVQLLQVLMRDKDIGRRVVPIVPDEGRTFGMESMIRQVGIYASQGQLYKPHDVDMLLYYREAKDGQMLEEGITEAGSMASFTAAGTAYSNYQVPMVPFFTFYSMFGFQRVGDLIWAFADARGKGFLFGGTAGRTTLAGEGLQHQDGHSIVLSSVVPSCVTYDPAYAYETAVIIQDGIRRMYQEREHIFYYVTAYNEDYPMPEMPEGAREGILRGIYKVKPAAKGKAAIHLFGSGTILNEALKAQAMLAEKYNVQADVWSVTSYTELRREALTCERWNRLHPAEPEKQPYILEALKGMEGPIVAASDYMKIVPDQLAPWLGTRLVTLGTDGFGRSDNREHLRRFFEVNAPSIVISALSRLVREGKFDAAKAKKAFKELEIDPEKVDPARS
jgi:pyruvate dehydrogenase E1 component